MDWVEDSDSTVQIATTAREDIRGIVRLLRQFSAGGGWADLPTRRHVDVGQLRRTAGIGMASTVAYLVLFLVLASPLGAFGANAAALGATTVLNTALHAGLRGRRRAATAGRSLCGTALSTAASLVLTTAALGVAHILGPTTENDLIALVLATFAATPLRFLAVHAAARSAPRQGARAASQAKGDR